jgi:hypothetical protein
MIAHRITNKNEILEVYNFELDVEGIPDALVKCPAHFAPVQMRQTGTGGAGHVTREEAYGGTDVNLLRQVEISVGVRQMMITA